MSSEPTWLDPGPPWAKITPAWWGFWVTYGCAPLAVTMRGPAGGEWRCWRRTREGAERKAQRLIDGVLASRVERGWFYEASHRG